MSFQGSLGTQEQQSHYSMEKIITGQSKFDQEPLFHGALDTLSRKPSLILFVGNCEEAKSDQPES